MRKLIFKLNYDQASNKLICTPTGNKNLAFGMTVDSTADLTPNAKEWFSKALLENGSRFNFRTIPNVKDSTKVGSLEFGTVLQAFDCDFDNTGAVLSAKTMSVCQLKVNTEICQTELEGSFISEWMRQGSNIAEFTPAAFLTHVTDRLGAKVSDELEIATWQGISTICTGLQESFSGSYSSNTVLVQLSGVSITSANVVAEITKVYNAIPTKLKNRKKDSVLYVSSNVADAYRLAVASQSNETYLLQDVALSFLGVKIFTAEGMSDNTMALSLRDNFVFLTDLLGDPENFTIIPMLNTTGEYKIRIVTALKAGFNYTNGKEIVFYSSLNNI